MQFFCAGADYPLNVICSVSWKVASIFLIIFVLWFLFYPKPKPM